MSKDKIESYFHKIKSSLLNARSDLSGRVYYEPQVNQMNRDIDILARTIYGEARGETSEGQKAVGLVILNRYKSNKWFAGKTVAETCLKPLQFSCWNKYDPNCDKISKLTSDKIKSFINLSTSLIQGKFADITNGATHYHTKDILPKWAKGKLPCAEIGQHIFYKNID